MDSIRLKTKELQSKMYLTRTQRLKLIDSRLIDSLDSQKRSTLLIHFDGEEDTEKKTFSSQFIDQSPCLSRHSAGKKLRERGTNNRLLL